MSIITISDRPSQNQQLFPLPPYIGIPTVTVNGATRSATMLPSGALVSPAIYQSSVVAITCDPAEAPSALTLYASPASAAQVNASPYCEHLILTPAGPLARLTIAFPPNPQKEGQQFRVSTRQTISLVTWLAGASYGAPASMPADYSCTFSWNVSGRKWVRI